MTPTPGQVNFEAFLRALVPPGQTPWHWLGDAERAAWEAAAQAVLVDTLTHWRAREAAALGHARAVVDIYRAGWTAPQLIQTIQELERWLDAHEDSTHA